MFATICEFASVHGDGTATLVHSGIGAVTVQDFPAVLRLSVYLETTPDELLAGEHQVALSVTGLEGEKIVASGKLNLTAVGIARLALPLDVTLTKMQPPLVLRAQIGKIESKLTLEIKAGA